MKGPKVGSSRHYRERTIWRRCKWSRKGHLFTQTLKALQNLDVLPCIRPKYVMSKCWDHERFWRGGEKMWLPESTSPTGWHIKLCSRSCRTQSKSFTLGHFSVRRSIYYNSPFVPMSTEPREQPVVSPCTLPLRGNGPRHIQAHCHRPRPSSRLLRHCRSLSPQEIYWGGNGNIKDAWGDDDARYNKSELWGRFFSDKQTLKQT